MFQKGVSGNPKGRPKGTVNKFADELKELMKGVVTANKNNLAADFKKLSPRDKWRVYLDIVQYFTPKMQSSTIELEHEARIQHLTDEQVNEIYNIILSSEN